MAKHFPNQEVNGVTTLCWHRLLNTYDPADVPIVSGSMYLLWAYGDTVGTPTGTNDWYFTQHVEVRHPRILTC